MTDLRRKVCERIFELDACSGDAPITEEILANHLGMSRTPVREVLHDLERDRLIERKKKKGIVLTRPDARKITEMYDARTALEGFAARLATDLITDSDVDELGEINERYVAGIAERDSQKYIAASTQFHIKIIDIAGNSIIADSMERFALLARLFYLKLPRTPLTNKLKNPFTHEMIIEVLTRCDPNKSEDLMRNHIQWGKQKAIELMLNTSVGRFEEKTKGYRPQRFLGEGLGQQKRKTKR